MLWEVDLKEVENPMVTLQANGQFQYSTTPEEDTQGIQVQAQNK